MDIVFSIKKGASHSTLKFSYEDNIHIFTLTGFSNRFLLLKTTSRNYNPIMSNMSRIYWPNIKFIEL